MRDDDGLPPDPAWPAGIDHGEIRRRLQALPLLPIAAFAARWGLRMERYLDRLEPRDRESARRLTRVVATVAGGGPVVDRLDATRAAFRFDRIAWRSAALSAWHRTRVRWAAARGNAPRFSAALAALDEAVVRGNLNGALARLAHAALTAEAVAFAASADPIDDFDETLAATRAGLIEAALTACATVATLVGAPVVGAAAASDLDRLAALVPETTDWRGPPVNPTSERLLGPLWPETSSGA